MISRRNIRVKVMQTLYAVETQFAESGEEKKLTTAEQVKILQKQFDQSQQLFVFMVHFLTELARYAETDARNRAAKHLPSAHDLSINTKLAGNEVLWKILESLPGCRRKRSQTFFHHRSGHGKEDLLGISGKARIQRIYRHSGKR